MAAKVPDPQLKSPNACVMVRRMKVWAFGGPTDLREKEQIYRSLTEGKSRFGWSARDENNLRLPDNWTPEHSQALFLLDVAPGDWIVHINVPKWGQCTAVRVLSGYDFDDGAGTGFRHCFEIDSNAIVPFDRRDPAVVPTVNLRPRKRYHRIYAVEDFRQTLENLKTGEPATLGNKTLPHLQNIVRLIHEFHPGKKLEDFFADVFECVPGVEDVQRNGSGWGTDYGADLIVTMRQCLATMELEHRIVVQVKSFGGRHDDLTAVDQIRTAIDHFKADAGMLITTAEPSDELAKTLERLSLDRKKPVELLAYTDVAKFVMTHAQHLLFP